MRSGYRCLSSVRGVNESFRPIETCFPFGLQVENFKDLRDGFDAVWGEWIDTQGNVTVFLSSEGLET